jgi:hypothetical protein
MVRVWRASDLSLVRVLRGHRGSVLCLLAVGHFLLSGARDNAIRCASGAAGRAGRIAWAFGWRGCLALVIGWRQAEQSGTLRLRLSPNNLSSAIPF